MSNIVLPYVTCYIGVLISCITGYNLHATSLLSLLTSLYPYRLPIGITSLLWLIGTMSVFSVLGFFFPQAQ